MRVIFVFLIYPITGALVFSYTEYSIWRIIAGALFGVSIGVNELKDGSSITSAVIGISGALCMLLSMTILGLLSVDNALAFYLFGFLASPLIYFIHARWS